MGIMYETCGTPKDIPATACTRIWTPGELDGRGATELVIGIEELAAATTVCGPANRMSAIRVKSGGKLMHDYTYAQLQAYCERFANNRKVTGGTAVVDTAVTGRTFAIPLNTPWASSQEQANQVQAMPNVGLQLELDFLAVANSTGNAWVHVNRETEPPRYYKTMRRNPCGVAASVRGQKVPLNCDGRVTAIAVPVASLAELEVHIGGTQVAKIAGRGFTSFEGATGANPDFLQGAEEIRDGTTGTTYQWLYFGGTNEADAQGSYLVWSATAAGAATDEFVVETLIEVGG